MGPVVRERVIRFEEVPSADRLAGGWTDVQEPGRYRLAEGADEMIFSFAASPDSAKRYTQPPRQTLFRMRGEHVEEAEPDAPRVALLGVRAT
ncbi:hypothetical protein GCM10010116_33700 [Microbispora rosea subsp. aerata]|nr:hypothetical protein [Microbispora rosea]GGO16692.1 hypothetical protein GCM10010116_33700 [Microbispora rosea subsp. aerata]GIH56018.1 hypothetical protein Mro02_29320 [Microbispora rosea subsp. aerata]GLJ86617.1 hypothetical protein GCM10017588_53550 [Microbispora rosea subsp. aerata]